MSSQILHIQNKNRTPANPNKMAELEDFDYLEGERIDPKTIIKNNNIMKKSISPCLTFSKLEANVLGILETILVKIIKEIPLPMPFSFICSPSHIRNNVPKTKVKTIVI